MRATALAQRLHQGPVRQTISDVGAAVAVAVPNLKIGARRALEPQRHRLLDMRERPDLLEHLRR